MKIIPRFFSALVLTASLVFATSSAFSAPMTPGKFVATIGQVGLLEIALGKVAQKNSANPDVKQFASYMVKSHTEIGKRLTKVAAGQGMKAPKTLNPGSKATLEKLSALKGTSFDTTYIPAMVQGHTEVLALLKKFAATTTDPELKNFAEKITPIIAMHLHHAKMVLADLKKNGEL
ncbi:MAG TPA: DUF4142 domain-containing protein [Chthoniobacterales bacterium]|nr:DUF4142 domain-containing protein [Chthoniobacterales bacterium]